MKKQKPKPASVEWVDSTTHAGWVRLDESNNLACFKDACRCVSTGTIIHKDASVLIIAGSVGLDPDGFIDQVCDVMTIPAACVVKVRRL